LGTEGLTGVRFGVITVSDTRSVNDDASGPAIVSALSALGAIHFETRIVPDELDAIRDAVLGLCDSCSAVFLTGGTGFSPRDVTPEAVLPLLDKRANGLEIAILGHGLGRTAFAALSRCVVGVRGSVLIVCLPGSPSGARDGVEAIAEVLPHVLSQICGDGCGHD
jgi:molybdenum cofactor synthesis domain-containing protein